MPINQQETHPQHQRICMHMHHPQHDQGIKQIENTKVDQRLNNCIDNGKNSNILHGANGQIEGGREEIDAWQRMKWTDEMVKLLITAAAYIGEYVNLSRQNKHQKKGKWRAISYAMMERGCLVSPQQCEDKFNDLKKKYKRLNQILGKGTACDVVENPSVMDSMNLSNETAEEIIKILSSKQLFYREMCSYQNGNRFFLPHDEDLEQSLRWSLEGKYKNVSPDQILEIPTKRKREGEDHGVVILENGLMNCEEEKNSRCPSTAGGEAKRLPNERWTTFRLQKLEEQKFKIEKQRLELEKKRLEWLRSFQNEERELEKMSLENKLIKLQNQRLASEIESHKIGRG